MERINRSQSFIIEYDRVLDKWIVWAKKDKLKIQVGTIERKRVGIWFKKLKREEEKK